MGFEVKIIADSISTEDIRLTTWQLKYPRFIHAEFMTHREFSRNASSSRAIPVKKMIEMVRDEPAMPIHWGMNQPGMQAEIELTGTSREVMIHRWQEAAQDAATNAEIMLECNAHKQVINRILEPFQWISVVMSTTRLSNFFGLRCHKDAQPEIKHLGDEMHCAYTEGLPTLLLPGEWHLPYINDDDRATAYDYCQGAPYDTLELLKKMSAARCARVSYLTHEGKVPNLQADLDLYHRLVGSQPMHSSPTEHQATPDTLVYVEDSLRPSNPDLHGNFHGWIQHRKLLAGEYIK